MAADLTTYDKALKNIYSPAVYEQLNSQTVLLKRLKRDTETFDGRQFIVGIHIKRNQRIGALGKNATALPGAPTQSNQGHENALYDPRYNWGVIGVLKTLIEQTKTREGSFVRAIRSEVQGMATDMAVDINRQLFGDNTGILADCTAQTAVTVLTLTLNSGRPFRFEVGMGVDVRTRSSGTAVATGRNITAISKANLQITIDGAAITTAATDSVYRAGNRNNETEGVLSIVKDTGAVGSLDPATAGLEAWAASRVHNNGTGRAVSEVLMQQAYDAPSEQGAPGTPSLGVATHATRRSYFNHLTGLKRFPNTTRLEGGFSALPFNDIPITVDVWAPKSRVFFLTEEFLRISQTGTPDWMDDDGRILKWDQATGYTGVYYYFLNLTTNRRNAHSVLEDINES